jgi:hypothetical protein
LCDSCGFLHFNLDFEKVSGSETEVNPTVIRAGGVRAEVAAGIDLTATTSGKPHAGWGRARRLRGQLDLLFASRTLGLVRVTGKRLGFALSVGGCRYRWRTLATLPKPTEQQSQKNKENQGEQVESQVEWHAQPLQVGGKWADHTSF